MKESFSATALLRVQKNDKKGCEKMSIRPIDIITIAPKSQEAANQQLGEQHRLQQNQSNLEHSFQQQIKQNTEQVVQYTPSENSPYRYDAKEKGNGSYQESKKKKRKKEEEKNSKEKEDPLGGRFDIKI